MLAVFTPSDTCPDSSRAYHVTLFLSVIGRFCCRLRKYKKLSHLFYFQKFKKGTQDRHRKLQFCEIHRKMSEYALQKFEDQTPIPSATKLRLHKSYLKNSLILSFKNSFPYLKIDLGWWNVQKFIITYLSCSGKNLVDETLFLHGQNFAFVFYFHWFWAVLLFGKLAYIAEPSLH